MGSFVGGLVLGFLLGMLDQWLRHRRRQLEAEIAEIQALRREVQTLLTAFSEARSAADVDAVISRMAALNGRIQEFSSGWRH